MIETSLRKTGGIGLKLKLRTRILSMIIVPIIGVALVAFLVVGTKGVDSIIDEVEYGLKGTAVAGLEAYENTATGDYKKDESGVVYKGDSFNITENAAIVDGIKEKSGYDVTFFFGDERIMTSVLENEKRIIGTKAVDKVIEAVLKNGKEYFAQNIVVGGEKYFGYYIPVIQESSGEVIGIFFAGQPSSDTSQAIQSMYLVLGIIMIVVVIAFILVGFSQTGVIIKHTKANVEMLNELANGQLQVTLSEKSLKRSDELGDIARSAEQLRKNLTGIIGDISNTASVLTDESVKLNTIAVTTRNTTSEVESAVNDVSKAALSQAEETQIASDEINEMGNMIAETLTEFSRLNAEARVMQESGDHATDKLNDLKKINGQTREAINIIYKQTHTTNESAQKIKSATELITSIAEETNLLSLNASIEAARAGEQGRGFAVVAAQIQKLADQSNQSAKDIESVINNLIEDSNETVLTMNSVKDIIVEQNLIVDTTSESFDVVKQGILHSLETSKRVEESAKALNKSRTIVVDVVQNLTAIAEENAASSEETSAATTEVANAVHDVADSAVQLSQLAEQLADKVKQFSL